MAPVRRDKSLELKSALSLMQSMADELKEFVEMKQYYGSRTEYTEMLIENAEGKING